MYKWFVSIAIALAVLLTSQPSNVQASTVIVNVTYEGIDYEASDGFHYSDQSTREATFNIPARTGFIIKTIRWESLDGVPLRNAAGEWAGKKSFVGTDTINGTSVNVKTIDTESYGGVFYWNRSGGTSLWKAVMSNGNNVTSSECLTAPNDSWGYKMYPNCNTLTFGDDALSLVLKKKGNYYIDGLRASPTINDAAVDLSTIAPAGIYPDFDTDVKNEIYGSKGKADPSTHYLDKYDVISKTSIRAYFNQVHDCTINGVPNNPDEPVCKYKDFANPGAKQMWWYSALKFQLQATTYRYEDKRLVVEWMPEENEITEIKVRHMVRSGPTGSYTQSAQNTTTLADPLPLSRTISADSSYGTVKGRNVNYASFSNSILNGTQVTVNLSSTQKTAYVTFFYEKPEPQFTGDFDIVPSVIEYRDSFSFVPKDFVMNSCTYQSHQYKIERNGTYITKDIKGMDKTTTYTRSNYPWLIGVGDHTVSIKIKTSCGESDWMGQKTLTVTDMGDNHPPEFKVGFVNPYNRTEPLTEVVEGTTLDLVYIDDPSVPTPTDPDGDLIYFMGFDTDGSSQDFVRSIPFNSQEYTDGFHGIVMDTLGFFSVSAQMRDELGLTANASTYIHVVPKNPVPIAKCPPFVVSNHPVDESKFDASDSYSPINRSIDHARDEWQNKLSSYVNETMSNLIETVKLDVYDSAGLKSVEPGVCSIVVKPDLPPVAKLEVPSVGIRNQPVDIINRSYSPDGDQIVSVVYKYKYDAKNNGFDDDAWQTINGSILKFSFKSTKVGKYLFYTKITEDFGKWDDTSDVSEIESTLDVVNDAPEVSFDLEGKNNQPDLEPYTVISASKMMDWPVYVSNRSELVYNKNNLWTSADNQLIGGEGKNFGAQQMILYKTDQERGGQQSYLTDIVQMVNNGYGNNRLSPYRSTNSLTPTYSYSLVDPRFERLFKIYGDDFKYRTNKKNLIFGQDYSTSSYNYYNETWSYSYNWSIYALNPKKLVPVDHEVDFLQYKYFYEDNQSPYDYIIKKPDNRRIDFNGTTNRYMWSGALEDYELADGRYIFVKSYWYADALEWVNDHTGEVSYYRSSYPVITVYDARNGEYMTSTLDIPSQQINSYGGYKFSHTKGRNVVMYERDYGTGKITFIEISPELEVVKKVTLNPPAKKYSAVGKPVQYNWMTLGEAFMVDAEGNMYSYQSYGSNSLSNGGIYDLNVTKISSDYQVEWRRYLTTSTGVPQYGPLYANTFMSAFTRIDEVASLVFDPGSNQILAKAYYDYVKPGNVVASGFEDVFVINANNGIVMSHKSTREDDDLSMYHYGNRHYEAGAAYTIDWDGRINEPNSTVTIDGNRTTFEEGSYCPEGQYTKGYNIVYDADGNVIGHAGAACNNGDQLMGEYIMDGVYMSMTKTMYPDYNYDYPQYGVYVNLSIGTPTNSEPIVKSFTSGQFKSNQKLKDADVKFSFSVADIDYDDLWFGYSFRMQDSRNRYSVESDGYHLALVKYINGQRTVLDSGTYPMHDETTYNVRLTFNGEKMNVWLNSIPILSATDEEYADGYFGYWADKSYITYSSLSYKPLESLELWSDQYAIWEEDSATAEINTDNIMFEDPENDPAAKLGWELHHTPRFLNNQGLSALDGQTIKAGTLTLGNVGDYLIALKGRDDPNPVYKYPNMTFDDYRKDSNEFTRKITVHRRPISDFDVMQQASDGKVIWTDHSRDPDRYESNTKYSTEDTGIDYKATKGIMEKRFYYVTPNGVYVAEKLVAPQETGTYEIGMAVKDEYGAWSEYHVEYLTIGQIATPNTPPKPGFTTSKTSTYRGVGVTINSTAIDAEDGDRTHLKHTYYMKNTTTNSAETIKSTSRTSWSTSFDTLGTYTIRQLVEDSEGASAQIEHKIAIVNRKPTAVVKVPSSANQNNPTKLKVLRPEFQWTYSDSDGDAEAKYQVRIYKYGGILLLDSDSQTGNELAWTANADLPEHVNMYVRVRVYDGFDWGEWSAAKYFYIETNRPPTVDFTWSPQPVYEGDTVAFQLSIADPDHDALHAVFEMKSPAGAITSYAYDSSYPYTVNGPSLPLLQTGNWQVKLTVDDGKATPVGVEKTVQVKPLSVSGAVQHTEQWNELRQSYNRNRSGNEESPRGYAVFWAGEKFLLEGFTTDTGTTVQATKVTVQFGEYKAELTASDDSSLHWTGELWDESFEQMENGPATFLFTAVYNNGTVKEDEVSVEVMGDVNQLVGVHRVK